MMKTLKTIILAALAMAATACTNELPNASSSNNSDGKTTINVSTGQKADTRVAYKDGAVGVDGKLTWQTGDKLTVVQIDENGKYITKADDYEYQGTDGATCGDFTGTAFTSVPGSTWMAYYPYDVTVNTVDGTATLPTMARQTQTADGNTEHLKNYMLLAATGIKDIEHDNFTLEMQSSIMKFDLGGVPAKVGKLKKLVWTVETDTGSKSITLEFAQGAIDFTNGNKTTLSAYLSFMPQDMVVKAGGKFIVTLTGDNTYQAEATVTNGKTYAAGKKYTATFGSWNTVMAFTVKVDDVNGLGFNIPFPTSGDVPAKLTVDWGDGSGVIEVASGAPLKAGDSFEHIYNAAGTYNITITSDEKDEDKQQIPDFNFYNNRDGDNNPSKLISIETPLLNMAATDLSSCFAYCSALTTIPKGLFDNNVAVTNLFDCFSDCSALTTIPDGLFDNNVAVTNLSGCFAYCSALTTIPDGLFDNNVAVTDLSSCFSDCSALTTIPDGLFDNNVAVTNLSGCFYGCSTLTTIPDGLFDNNVGVTSFLSCFSECSTLTTIPDGLFDNNVVVTDFIACFENCSALTTIPKGLFDNNVAVTELSYCFNGCSALTTIPDGLFDNNVAVTSFDYCFENCSALTTIPDGLFANKEANSFPSCFANCSNLKLNPLTFIRNVGEKDTRFTNAAYVFFGSCFENAGSSRKSDFGTAPDLWNYTYKNGVTPGTYGCFVNTKFVDGIPTDWGGKL